MQDERPGDAKTPADAGVFASNIQACCTAPGGPLSSTVLPSISAKYSEGPSPSTTRVLEQHITRLQSRIQELEQDDPSLVRLHDPYRNYHEAERAGSTAPSSQGAQLNWWETPDPPAQMQQTLQVQYI